MNKPNPYRPGAGLMPAYLTGRTEEIRHVESAGASKFLGDAMSYSERLFEYHTIGSLDDESAKNAITEPVFDQFLKRE